MVSFRLGAGHSGFSLVMQAHVAHASSFLDRSRAISLIVLAANLGSLFGPGISASSETPLSRSMDVHRSRLSRSVIIRVRLPPQPLHRSNDLRYDRQRGHHCTVHFLVSPSLEALDSVSKTPQERRTKKVPRSHWNRRGKSIPKTMSFRRKRKQLQFLCIYLLQECASFFDSISDSPARPSTRGRNVFVLKLQDRGTPLDVDVLLDQRGVGALHFHRLSHR